jgi:hypothetical protein
MLLILILITWLAVTIVCVAVCVMAARGDSTSIAPEGELSNEPESGTPTPALADDHAAPHTAAGTALERNPLELLLYDGSATGRGPVTGRGGR